MSNAPATDSKDAAKPVSNDPLMGVYAAAFTLWEQRYREDPSAFLSADEAAAMAVASNGEARAIYFRALLREVGASWGAASLAGREVIVLPDPEAA